MEDSLQSCDPSPSPKIARHVKTLDEEALPNAPIRAIVTHSLALSSPINQIQIQVSPPAKLLAKIQNQVESPFSPSLKTLVAHSSDKNEENECRDSQIRPLAQVSPDNNASTSYSLEATRDSYNRPPRRYMADFDYQSYEIESTKPVEFSWSSLKIKPTGVGAGLDNSGNTCFIASVLQCLTHTVPLIESLRSYKYQNPCNCGNEKFCVMRSLREHIELALRSSGYNLKIDLFRDNLNHFSPDFQINNQEDAHEFLQSFLNKLERCCLDCTNRPDSITSQDVNIVEHVFGGRLLSRLHCCNCNSFSDTFEPSLGWSLEIEDVDNLWSALESFTRVEKLEDQFMCDNCKEKVSKEKQLKLDKLPMVATFHLKRFKNDGLTMEKIFKRVHFPLELDLLPYMSSNENPEVSTKYHLYAMVEHLGNGVSFGHYSSYVRSSPETWHNFDDAKVRRISEDSAVQQNAYLLFYAREGTPWFSSAFEELKTLFEANPLNLSPKSVLEREERYVSDHSYNNVNKACNNSVSGGSSLEEVFHSAESSSSDDDSSTYDAQESPKADEFEKPVGDDDNASVPLLKIQKQDSSTKRKGTFQNQRGHLQNKKKKKKEIETRGTKLLRNNVGSSSSANPKDKQFAISFVKRMAPTSRNRMLAAALGIPIKRKKISNIK